MPQHEPNKRDQHAARCVALLLHLIESGPQTPGDIVAHLEEYALLGSVGVATKAVMRDAAELAPFGVRVDARGPHGHLIRVSSATYADLSQLKGPGDAARVAVVISALSYDPRLSQADDLRAAFTKIVGRPLAPAPPAASPGDDIAKRLSRAVEVRQTSHLRYRDARGVESERVVRPFGLFDLNGHTYVVAETLSADFSDDSRDGHDLAEEPQNLASQQPSARLRTYRDDRIVGFSVATPAERKAFGKTYEIPADFDAGDWRVLPFQIGPSLGEVGFSVPEARLRDVAARAPLARDHAWELEVGASGPHALRVGACGSWEDAARWAIGMGVVPTHPVPVCDAYQGILRAACVDMYSLAPLAEREAELRRRGRRGRPSTAPTTQQLLTLLNLFVEPGQEVSADEIMRTLDVTRRRARELADLLGQVNLAFGYLPIDPGERRDTWQLSEWTDFRATRLRLTRREAQAVEDAVARLGLEGEMGDGYARVKAAFWPLDQPAPTPEARPPVAAGGLTALFEVDGAIQAGKALRFSYQGLRDDAPRERLVLPRVLLSHNGVPYVLVLDLADKRTKRFRVDRMDEVSAEDAAPGDLAEAARAEAGAWFADARRVRVRFGDARALTFFNWGDVVELRDVDEGAALVSVADLGGDWLARHVAAWGDTAQTDDLDLARRVATYAKGLLEGHAGA